MRIFFPGWKSGFPDDPGENLVKNRINKPFALDKGCKLDYSYYNKKCVNEDVV